MKKLSIRNILVPIDFSKMSIQAIETAKRVALRFGGSVHLAHVYQFDYPAGFMAPGTWATQPSIAAQEQHTRVLTKNLGALAREHNLSPETCHLSRGAPSFDEICRIAQQISADLIVMPTHGYTGLRHVFLGSTAERVVQHSPCPVFVVRPRKRKSETGRTSSAHTILVPVDFSNSSREGLRYAIRFANEFGARLRPGAKFDSQLFGKISTIELLRSSRGTFWRVRSRFLLSLWHAGCERSFSFGRR